MATPKTRTTGINAAPVQSKSGSPAQLENLAVVRTVVAAIGTFEDLDFDAVVRSAAGRRRGMHATDPIGGAELHAGAGASIRATTRWSSTRRPRARADDILTPGSFSWHVLSSLTDEVTTFQDGQGAEEGQVFGISMTTRRASSLR